MTVAERAEWRRRVGSLPWPYYRAPVVALRSAVDDINITLMRSPEELREDKSVFMNQGEWELLHVLSKYKSFSVDNDDYYAEMKFHVRLLFLPSHVVMISNSGIFLQRQPEQMRVHSV